MNEQEIRKIVNDEIQKKIFRFPKSPPHRHNGIDNIRINAKDIVGNNKFLSGLTATAPGGTATISSGIYNPQALYFYGFARNPVSSTATYKGTITGHAEFGSCFQINNNTVTPVTTNVVQTNICSMFDGSTGFWVPSLNFNDNYVASAYLSGVLEAYIQIISFTKTSITFNSVVNSGWILEGDIIIV